MVELRCRRDLPQFFPLDALPRNVARLAVRGEFRFLEVAQDGLGPLDDRLGYAGQTRDVEAVTLVCSSLGDLVQKHDLFVPLAHGDVEVAQSRQAVG